jgi:hypothetical protein
MVGTQSEQKNHSQEGRKCPSELARAYLAVFSWNITEIGPGPWEPSDLFAACRAEEQKFEKVSGKEFLLSRDKIFLFGFPLFCDEPGDFANDSYPLQFTIARPKDAKGLNVGWRYTELLRYLRKLDDTELRWLLIARWLDEERICDPEDFLPKGVLQRMVKRLSKRRMRVAPTDWFLWKRVMVWRPYFESLLADRHKLGKINRGREEALLKKGYRRDAIELALGRHSAVQATTSWLEQREGFGAKKRLTARTLENAYSRVQVAIQNTASDFQKFQAQQSDSKPR